MANRADIKKLADAYGAIDIEFNNADLMLLSDIESLETDEWHRMVNLNVKGLPPGDPGLELRCDSRIFESAVERKGIGTAHWADVLRSRGVKLD